MVACTSSPVFDASASPRSLNETTFPFFRSYPNSCRERIRSAGASDRSRSSCSTASSETKNDPHQSSTDGFRKNGVASLQSFAPTASSWRGFEYVLIVLEYVRPCVPDASLSVSVRRNPFTRLLAFQNVRAITLPSAWVSVVRSNPRNSRSRRSYFPPAYVYELAMSCPGVPSARPSWTTTSDITQRLSGMSTVLPVRTEFRSMLPPSGRSTLRSRFGVLIWLSRTQTAELS